MIKLREYQSDLVMEAQIAHFLWRSVLIVLSTGGGKTVVFSQITLDAIAESQSVWIIAHRQELIAQASKTLTTFGIPHGIIKAGSPYDATQRVQVASIQTLVRRYQTLPAPDLIVIDEAHHSVSPTYLKVIEHFSSAKILGVTATPCRLNGAGLNTVFQHMILGPTVVWLTENGFLSPARYFEPPPKADTSKLRVVGGDYVRSEAEEVMDKPEITGDAISHYRNICNGEPMIVFCASVKHAADVAEEYRAAGYRATHVDGKLSDDDRLDRLGGLGTGKYQVVASCDLIGEGLDIPNVVAVQLLAPTASLPKHVQQIGRPLRFIPGKTAIVLDHVGNKKHGFPWTIHRWTLEGKTKKASEKPPATRTCESCYSVHRPAPSCPYCGFTYVVKSKALTAMKMVDGELVEVEQSREERLEEVANARTLSELVAIAKSRGYKKPHYWSLRTLRGRSYTHLLPKI